MDDLVRKPYRASEIFDCMARQLGLTFRSEETAAPVESTPILRHEAFAALPEELRTELANAVLALNIRKINAAIARVSERDARLGSALAFHAERLTFTTILDVLGECERNTI
jgi:hypothetical protein